MNLQKIKQDWGTFDGDKKDMIIFSTMVSVTSLLIYIAVVIKKIDISSSFGSGLGRKIFILCFLLFTYFMVVIWGEDGV